MNIAYKLDQINLNNLFFMDSKKNIIMDGKFTKILYSDELLTTNGVSLIIPFHNTSIDKTYNKLLPKKPSNPVIRIFFFFIKFKIYYRENYPIKICKIFLFLLFLVILKIKHV